MGVGVYSLKKDGDKLLSENFKVREFACNDRSDEILIDSELVKRLQRIRNKFNKPCNINSAYRTKAYNIKIGGASRSQHILGKAADITISGVNPLKVALYAEEIYDYGGIGVYPKSGFTHIDSRATCSRWVQYTQEQSVSAIMPTLCKGDRGESVKVLQMALKLSADGIFGVKTKSAVMSFQRKHSLVVDGICGRKTWNKLIYG